MSAISIESFLPVAAHFRITPSYLYQQVSQAGESFHFDVSFISSIQTVIPAGLFYQHVDIQVRGQNTNHTHFTYCNISIDPTQLLGSFHVCVNTTVADTYDLILLYDGVPLLGMPCLGCIQIIPSQVAIANTVVTGLTDTLLAGTSLSFTIQLRDEYNNLVDPSSLFISCQMNFSISQMTQVRSHLILIISFSISIILKSTRFQSTLMIFHFLLPLQFVL